MSILQQIEHAKIEVAKSAIASPHVYHEWGRLQVAAQALSAARKEYAAALAAWRGLIEAAPPQWAKLAPPEPSIDGVPEPVRDQHGYIVLHNGREVVYRDEVAPGVAVRCTNCNQALEGIRADEREQCARLCESIAVTGPLDEERIYLLVAKMIRSRTDGVRDGND